jgi:hypothetical protein
MVFGRELRLPCDLLFGAPPDKEQSTTGYVAILVERLHDTHHYGRRHLRVASDRMKASLVNSAGFQEGERVWLYRPKPDKRMVTKAAVGMGRPVQGHHPE